MTQTTITPDAVSYIPTVNQLWQRLCQDPASAMLYTVGETSVVFYEATWHEIETGVPPCNWFILDADNYCTNWFHCEEQVNEFFAQSEPTRRRSWFERLFS